LLCILFILPVVFTTQIKTAFRVDQSFFQELSLATYTAELPVEENGELVVQEATVHVDPLVINQLRRLEGTEYASARDFITATQEVLDPTMALELEPLLVDIARSNNWYWLAVLLIALAAGGHQAWSANLLTLPSDLFPKKAVASVVGIGGMVGAVAGLLADFSLGQVLRASGTAGYFFAFLVAGLVYIVALVAIHLLVPKMIPLDENLKRIR
ncbi:MAG: hypothetical protein KDC54_05590, partial [Lewinella sp.]|nr:hypothetical protein [Lewinella sp.]